MNISLKKIVILMVFAAILSSCSLLKISTDFGIEPLPTNELNTRLALRMYGASFNNIVVISADSIASLALGNVSLHRSERDTIIKATIKWKRAATIASVGSSLNSVTSGAVVNCWALVEGMSQLQWRELLEYAPMARESSKYLLERYREAIKPFLEEREAALMGQFIDSVVVANPLDLNFEVKDYTYEWLKYSKVPDTLMVKSVGSISEVIDDLNHKIGVYSRTAYNQIDWGADQLRYNLNSTWQDPVTQKALDSLKNSLAHLKGALSSLPENADTLVRDLFYRSNMAITRVDYVINKNLDSAFNELNRVTEGLTAYITDERIAIINSAEIVANSVVESAINEVYTLIKSLLIYLLLFVLIIVGIPFYVGYRVGRRRGD